MDTKKKIKQLMKDRDWSDYMLAQKSGLSQSTISNLFNRNNEPTIPTLTSICSAFNMTLAQFFSEGPAIELTVEQRTLFQKWTMLNDRQKTMILELIDSYISE